MLVIDASVVLKWYLPEDDREYAERLTSEDFELHAPDLIIAELGNVLWKKCRAGDMDSIQSKLIADSFLRQNIKYHSLKNLLAPALLGANEFGQTVYDWTYLALAISLDCKFVTADRRFFIAMRKTHFSKEMVWIESVSDLS